MSDLTGFLLARIAEDEQWAQVAAGRRVPVLAIRGDNMAAASVQARSEMGMRMLAECAAKRRVVNDYAELWQEAKRLHYAGEPEDLITTARNMYAGLHLALRNLAAVYADHPDYRDEWRP